jgi:hypothetical protein
MPIVLQASPIFRRRANYQINPLRVVSRGMGQSLAECIAARGSAAACGGGNSLAAPQARDYSNAPGCHVIDLANDICMMDNGYRLKCSAIRECDPLTGTQHCQYPLPGQTDPSQTVNPTIPFCTGQPGQANVIQAQKPAGEGTAFTPSGVDLAQITAAAVKAATQSNQSILQTPSSAPVTNGAPISSGPTAQSNAPSPGIALPPSIQAFFSTPSGNWFDGIPNWLLIAGVVGGGLLLFSGGRR